MSTKSVNYLSASSTHFPSGENMVCRVTDSPPWPTASAKIAIYHVVKTICSCHIQQSKSNLTCVVKVVYLLLVQLSNLCCFTVCFVYYVYIHTVILWFHSQAVYSAFLLTPKVSMPQYLYWWVWRSSSPLPGWTDTPACSPLVWTASHAVLPLLWWDS